MNFDRLHVILSRTTLILSNDEAAKLTRCLEFEFVDCHFVVVSVDKIQAELFKDELVRILKDYPHPERLDEGPSSIEVGRIVGNQEEAFKLFALGQVLGLWKVVTPVNMGVKGRAADILAHLGWVRISGVAA